MGVDRSSKSEEDPERAQKVKPTIENIRKAGEKATNQEEVLALRDLVSFWMAGVKEAALFLGASVNDVQELLDKGRAADDFLRSDVLRWNRKS